MTPKRNQNKNKTNSPSPILKPEVNMIDQLMNDSSFLDTLADKIASKVNTKLEQRVLELEAKVDSLQGENSNLRNKLDDLEQYGRRNNIRIFGFKEERGEDTVAKVVDLVNSKLNVQISSRDIDACHRLGKAENGKPRAIICKFVSRLVRDRIYFAKSKLKGAKMSIKEDLTREKMALYKKVTESFDFRQVWTVRGKVFLSHNDQKFAFNNHDEYMIFFGENCMNGNIVNDSFSSTVTSHGHN